MTRGLVSSSKYSPGNLTRRSLEELFVGRDKLLGDILRKIELSATTAQKHRILVIGPRGIGKTHLISLVVQRLRTDPDLAGARERLVISRLNEEEWGIASYVDLLLRVIAACDAPEIGRDAAQRRIYAAHERGETEAIAAAESALGELVGDRTLLLVCENLGDLLSGIGTSGQQRWRSFMQERGFWCVLATTTQMVSAIRHHEAPFHGFFTVRNLEPIDFETAVLLLQRKAHIDGKPELARLLGSSIGRARVRAIHHLAGGNPRVYIVIAEFIDEETLDDLLGPFMAMADDLTPYYQSRMQVLSPQQRKLVEQMARLARPRPVKVIAERCLITQQTAAKQLGLLARQGIVRRHRIGRETYCELAEPLMRICFEIKDNRTDHLRLFVDLLRHWFSETELRDRLGRFEVAGASVSLLDRTHLEAALAEYQRDPERPFMLALTEEQRRCLDQRDWQGLEMVTRKILEERQLAVDYALLMQALCEQGRFEDASDVAARATERCPDDPKLSLFSSMAFMANDEPARALREIDRAMDLEPDPVSFAARMTYRIALGDWQGVLDDWEVLADLGNEPHRTAMYWIVTALGALGRETEQREVALRWLQAEPNDFIALCQYADLIAGDVAPDDVISEQSGCSLQASVAVLIDAYLHFRASRVAECMAVVERVLDESPENDCAIILKVRCLLASSRYAEALATLQSRVPATMNAYELEDLEARALAGTKGLILGVESLVQRIHPSLWLKQLAGHAMGRLFAIEVEVRGPVSLARQVRLAMSAIVNPKADEIVAAALVWLLQLLRFEGRLSGQEWAQAVEILAEDLAGVEACQLVVEMLSVAVKHANSNDDAVLMELPPERRALLESIGSKPPPGYTL